MPPASWQQQQSDDGAHRPIGPIAIGPAAATAAAVNDPSVMGNIGAAMGLDADLGLEILSEALGFNVSAASSSAAAPGAPGIGAAAAAAAATGNAASANAAAAAAGNAYGVIDRINSMLGEPGGPGPGPERRVEGDRDQFGRDGQMHQQHQHQQGWAQGKESGYRPTQQRREERRGQLEVPPEMNEASRGAKKDATAINAAASAVAKATETGTAPAAPSASNPLLPRETIDGARSVARDLRALSSRSHDQQRRRRRQQADLEEFYSLLQTCRSGQTAVMSALERAMTTAAAASEEGELAELLELNEFLLRSIEVGERFLMAGEDDDEEEGRRRQQEQQRTKEAEGLAPLEEGRDSRRQQQRAGQSAGASESVVLESVAKSASAAASVAAEAPPKKAKKKRIRKKKDKAPKVDEAATAEAERAAAEAKARTELEAAERAKEERAARAAEEEAERAREEERQRLAKMREEVRRQQAAARERKKDKKSRKHDRWVAEREHQGEARAKMWSDEIAREAEYVELLVKLSVAEFVRQHKSTVMGLGASRVGNDEATMGQIRDKCREAYQELYRGQIKSRVVVAGLDGKSDLNGRHGAILHWDGARGEYCVGLDTKKGRNADVHYLKPENLDVDPHNNVGSKGKKKGQSTTCTIDHPNLLNYGGMDLGLNFVVSASDVQALRKSPTIEEGLRRFASARDAEELRRKAEEEEERQREEEDRKRRAEMKARENEAWERRKERMEKEKAEYAEWMRQQRQQRQEGGRRQYTHHEYGDEDDDDDDDDDDYDFFGGSSGRCRCARCQFQQRFGGNSFFFGGGGFFFSFGGRGGFPFSFDSDDDDDDDDDFFGGFFDGFDEQWSRREEERREAENAEHAEILGVPVDADSRTIKTTYRKMALQYHPDKWKDDSSHGMSRDDAEDHFKKIQNAYDHLMANFDD